MLHVADASGEEEFKKIPLNVETWFTPEPLLLLTVLYETFKFHWLFAKIPVAGFDAKAAPPKLTTVFPVAELDPPMLLLKSPKSNAGATALKPISTTPALPPLMVFEIMVLFEFDPAADVGVNTAAVVESVFKMAIPIEPLCQGAIPAALFKRLKEMVQFLIVLN